MSIKKKNESIIHSNLNPLQDETHSREYIFKYSKNARAILPRNYSEKYLQENAICQQASNGQPQPRKAKRSRQVKQPRQAKQSRKQVSNERHHPRQQREQSESNLNHHDQKLLLAKQEKEIKLLKDAVRNLNDKLGAEDLTIEKKRLGEVLLSSSEDESISEDGYIDVSHFKLNRGDGCANGNALNGTSNGDAMNEAITNKENIPLTANVALDVQPQKMYDMMFSFSHEYVEIVSA